MLEGSMSELSFSTPTSQYVLFWKCPQHTLHLSFLLHRQDFRKPNFTPKKRLKSPKTLKMSLKKSNICIFSLNLEKFTPDRKFIHRHVCGVCDKYEVWSELISRKFDLYQTPATTNCGNKSISCIFDHQ